MKSTEFVKKAISKFDRNELIKASSLYKEEFSGKITEAAYYKTLQRLCETGELVKIAKGTYHLPKLGKYGVIPPSEKEIISAFTDKEKGTVIGYTLYNELNLTTQIPKNITIMSSAIESFTKSIRNIVVYQTPLQFTENVKNIVHGLDVLQNFSSIQDINYCAFFRFTEELALSFRHESFEEVMLVKKYKKSTISFLREILEYYNVENNLGDYLSALSEYKHPKMEELYEFTRIS